LLKDCERTNLLFIDLTGSEIGDEGAKAVAEALRVNKSIMVIGLMRNRIGDEGAKALVEALRVNFTVLQLSVENWPFHTETIKLTERNESLCWEKQHAILLNICIAMYPFDLPAYILLWIYDQFGPGEASINQLKKISLIESFKESVRALGK